MASVNQPQDEETNNQQPAGAPVATGGAGGAGGTSGQGAGVAGAAAPSSPVAQNQAPQNNNGYTDVASYLDANKAGSADLGNKVASNLNNAYTSTKSGIDSSAQAVQALADQGYTHENSSLISQAASNPTGAASNPGTVSDVQAQLNDTYTGPTGWEDYGTQQGNVATAQQEGALNTTPGGMNVLAGQVEGGAASQGVNQLDTMLLGDPNAAATVKAAADPFATLTNYLDSANTATTGAITGAQNNAATAQADAQNAFLGPTGAYTNLSGTITGETSDAVAKAQAQQAALNADIANLYGGQAVDNTATTLGGYGGTTNPWVNTTNYTVGQLSPQDLASLGITQGQWNALQSSMQQAGTTRGYSGHNFGANSGTSQIDVSQWLNQLDPSAVINNSNVATPEQAQQLTALQTLLGSQTPTGLTLDPTQAGTYDPASLNTFDYADALSGANATAAAQNKAAQDEANALTSSADQQHAASQHGGIINTIKSVVNNPWKAANLDPRNALSNLKNAMKGEDPLGNDPLPNKQELAKLGLNRKL